MISDKILKNFRKLLSKEGLKMTTARVSILEDILSNDSHRECDQIHKDLLNNKIKVSRATIYRTLDVLVKYEYIRKLDIGDGKILTNPLAQKLQDTEKEKENINQEYSNLLKIQKKMKKEHKREIQLVSTKAPEQRFIDLVQKNELDKKIKEEGLIHKSSGAINWTGLARMIGLRDGKTAKKYAEKYAPYLLRDDEEGYTI